MSTLRSFSDTTRGNGYVGVWTRSRHQDLTALYLEVSGIAHVRDGSFPTELSRQQVGPCPLCSDSDPILQPSEMSRRAQEPT
jgi:hypothetical protein